MNKKHREVLAHPDVYKALFSNSEKWGLEIPPALFGQLVLC